ncbi:hypothetical protein [Martelella endophytica]|nr:hypothetical protein [Martelella endophytica]
MPERTSRKAQTNTASAELALIAAVILAAIAAVLFAATQLYIVG